MSAVILSLAAVVLAQSASPDPSPLPMEARTRLAVMRLAAPELPEALRVGLTETIATHIDRTEVFETISPEQVATLLAYEKRRDLLGDCFDEACFTRVGRWVRAQHILGGSIGKAGDRFVLNLVVVDIESGTALARTTEEADSAAELLSSSKAAAITVLQPLLEERRGFVRIDCRVPDAELVIDGLPRIEGVGQVIPLAAGPHAVRIEKEGFYPATAELHVLPGRVRVEQVSLIPARATVQRYERKARAMRIGAWTSGAIAVGAAALSGFFYAQASDDQQVVEGYVGALDVQQTVDGRSAALEAESSFQTNQALYLSFLGTAVLTGATSLVLFLVGDDPGRYEEFDAMNR
jgi:TolB-like protein